MDYSPWSRRRVKHDWATNTFTFHWEKCDVTWWKNRLSAGGREKRKTMLLGEEGNISTISWRLSSIYMKGEEGKVFLWWGEAGTEDNGTEVRHPWAQAGKSSRSQVALGAEIREESGPPWKRPWAQGCKDTEVQLKVSLEWCHDQIACFNKTDNNGISDEWWVQEVNMTGDKAV